MTHDTIIYNGTVVNDGASYRGYVVVDGHSITAVGRGDAPAGLIGGCTRAVDCEGALILPGAIDDQVHFRDPGLTHKADTATESAAAVAGGVTSFMDMPNTKPPRVTCAAVDESLARAAGVSHANYSYYLGATSSNLDELLAADYSRIPGVKLFLGSSTGNMLVDGDEVLDRIFSEVKALIAVHSEDDAIISRERQRLVAERGHDLPPELHPVMRSREACTVSTRRAIDRARRFGTRLHVLHLSTAEEAMMFEPLPPELKRITSEVCVHHLWFSAADYARLGNRIKMNPAIKDPADREALRRALVEGRIDVVATDHAPHLLSEKEGNLLEASSGAPMVQFSLPLMLEMADSGLWSRELVVEKMCHAPARLFGVDRRGYLRPGYYADITVVDPSASYTVTDAMALSRCGWTPLAGTTLHNRVVATWVNGTLVWWAGATAAPSGLPLSFNK